MLLAPRPISAWVGAVAILTIGIYVTRVGSKKDYDRETHFYLAFCLLRQTARWGPLPDTLVCSGIKKIPSTLAF